MATVYKLCKKNKKDSCGPVVYIKLSIYNGHFHIVTQYLDPDVPIYMETYPNLVTQV